MRKVIVIAADATFVANVDEKEKEQVTQVRIRASLGTRHFRWYYLNEMRELVLKDAPTTLKGFQEL